MAAATDQEVVHNVLIEMSHSATDLVAKAEHVLAILTTMSLDREGNELLFGVAAVCQEIDTHLKGKLLRWKELSSGNSRQ